MSIAPTILGILSIGFLFVVPALLLIISTFVYLEDEPVVEVNEKSKRSAFAIAFVSLFVALAATVPEVSSSGSMLALAFGLIFYLFPLIPPILGIVGIRGEFKREMVDARLKKIALVLAGIALVAAMVITLYSEVVLVTGGCYAYQTSPTSGGRICSDFRPDYVIPAIISALGIAGILRENKLLLYASATASFIRIVVYLQPIASLFLPSFIAMILSAFVYKLGIHKAEPQEENQSGMRGNSIR